MNVLLQVGGKKVYIDATVIPPVGTRIHVHKHVHDGGHAPTVEVLDHEWRLDEPQETENGDTTLATLAVHIKTRIVS